MEKIVKGTYFATQASNCGYYCWQILNVDYNTGEALLQQLDEISGPFGFSIQTLEDWVDNNMIQIMETEKELLVFRMKYC